jgi:hypothetical protein
LRIALVSFACVIVALISMFTADDDAGDGAVIQVDPADRRAVITWAAGVPVFNPWMTTIERLLSDPQFKPEFAVISDWRAATGSPDQAFVDAFLVFCQSIRRARRLTGRWATVISAPTPDQSSLGRTAELQANESSSDTRVFTDFDDARAWTSGKR